MSVLWWPMIGTVVTGTGPSLLGGGLGSARQVCAPAARKSRARDQDRNFRSASTSGRQHDFSPHSAGLKDLVTNRGAFKSQYVFDVHPELPVYNQLGQRVHVSPRA